MVVACDGAGDRPDEDDGGGASGSSGLGLGEPCADGAECASGACADGICCDAVCDGPCRACSAEGVCTVHAFGPAPEAGCEAGVCDGSGTCASGQVKWVRLFPGPENDGGTHVVFAPDDGVLVNGTHHATVNFGGGEFPDYDPSDPGVFQLKLDAAGNHVWSSSELGTVGMTTGTYAYDSEGRGYVAGALKLGAETGPLGLLDDEGKLASLLVSGTDATASSVDLDDNGDIALSTRGGTLCGQSGAVIAKLTRDGGCTWARAINGTYADVLHVAFDSAGAIVVAAMGVSPLDLGAGPVTGGDGEPLEMDVFVAKYDAGGNLVWGRGFAGVNHARSIDGIETAGENVIFAGEFDGTLEIGDAPFFSQPMQRVGFVAALDAGGKHVWSRQLSNTMGYVEALEVDRSGNVIVAGWWQGTIDVGAGPMIASEEHMFLIKLTAWGQHLWSKDLDGGLSRIEGIAAAPDGQLAITGGVWDIMLDGMLLTTSGKQDVLVARLSP
jgi:hypothetical protein